MIDRKAGWGADPKPEIYEEACAVADALRREAQRASDEAWALDMALKNVRFATTAEEKETAIARLARSLSLHQVRPDDLPEADD